MQPRRRWQIALPCLGLLLFAVISYQSVLMNREAGTTRYQYWSSIKLDTDPLGQREPTFVPCKDDPAENCAGWGPVIIWVHPGLPTKIYMISALPAFIAGAVIVGGLGRLGINQVVTFAISMPILIAAWFFWIGRSLDGFIARRRKSRTSPMMESAERPTEN